MRGVFILYISIREPTRVKKNFALRVISIIPNSETMTPVVSRTPVFVSRGLVGLHPILKSTTALLPTSSDHHAVGYLL